MKRFTFPFKYGVLLIAISLVTTSTYAQETSNVVAYFKFDETSGTSVAEDINSLDGTLTNAGDEVWSSGLDGNAIDFGAANVTNAYVEVPSSDAITFSTESFSIGAVVKLTELTTKYQIIAYKGNLSDDVDGHWYSLFVYSDKLLMYIDDKATTSSVSTSISDISFDEWNYFVCVRDAENAALYLYVNGVQVATAADNSGDITSTLPLMIGNMASLDGQFTGSIDELKIYNTALSADEVASLNTVYGCPTTGTGVNDILNSSGLSVYPNPTNGELHIEGCNPKMVEIYSIDGSKAMTVSPLSNKIDVSTLNKGAYFLRVTNNDNRTQTFKFNKL